MRSWRRGRRGVVVSACVGATLGLLPASAGAQTEDYAERVEVELLLGDPAKAKEKLGWVPQTTVEELAGMMVDHDMELAAREKTLKDAGHELPEFSGHDQ